MLAGGSRLTWLISSKEEVPPLQLQSCRCSSSLATIEYIRNWDFYFRAAGR
jgi:hypothetical protein